jgi:membrane associated rhomboid family serine protease
VSLVPYPRLTPWVVRLSAVNVVVLLLMMTVFTSPSVVATLAFDPRIALARPWTFVTYAFLHNGLLHVAMNTLGLVIFGPAVEERMGGRSFLLYYLYCALGGALFTLGLSGLVPTGAMVGASAAVLGIMVAYAVFWPDAELLAFPLPMPIKARTLVLALVGISVVLAFLPLGSGVANGAHVGGALFGYLFFRLQAMSHRAPAAPTRAVPRVVMVQSGSGEPARRSTPVAAPHQRRRPDADPVAAEMDRVLDKISAEGIESLTADERRFLFEVSKRKKDELH